MKKAMRFALAFVLGASMLTGCGNNATSNTGGSASTSSNSTATDTSAKGSTTLNAMCVGTESDSYTDDYKAIVDAYNESNEHGVTVDMKFYENEQYKTKLTTLMASNAVPDIFFTWELAYLRPFVEGGKVADITSFLKDDQAWADSFSEGTLSLLSYDDKNYAVPTQKSLCVMFYNKQIFEENGVSLPTTFEEFLNICETLKSNGITPLAMSGADAWIPAQFVQQISNGIAGMDLYNGIREGTTKWNAEEHVAAGKELQAMVDAGYFQDGFIGMGPEESTALFESGKTAMYFQGAWDCGRISVSPIGEVASAFTLPAMNPANSNISVGSVDTCFAIAESCSNKDAAAAFLKFWTSTESEEALLYNEGRMPAGVFDIDASKLNPLFAEVLQLSNQQQGLTPWWDRAFGAGEGTEFNNTCVAICGGDDVQASFDTLQKYSEDNADR